MFIFLGILLFIVFILIIVQIYFACFYDDNCAKNDNVYSSDIAERGDAVMLAVKEGRIKKHILINDAKPFNSAVAREKYKEFIGNSSLYRNIVDFKGTRYNG